MKKVLIYKNRKTSPTVFDISTPEKEKKAYLQLFDILEHWNVFNIDRQIQKTEEEIERLENPESILDEHVILQDKRDRGKAEKMKTEDRNFNLEKEKLSLKKLQKRKKIYEKAKHGNAKAAKRICEIMKGNPYCEYERHEIKNQ